VIWSKPAVFLTRPDQTGAGSEMPLAVIEAPAAANASSATTSLLEDDFIAGFLFSLIEQQAQGLTPVSIVVR
jgi:hypothetical protein